MRGTDLADVRVEDGEGYVFEAGADVSVDFLTQDLEHCAGISSLPTINGSKDTADCIAVDFFDAAFGVAGYGGLDDIFAVGEKFARPVLVLVGWRDENKELDASLYRKWEFLASYLPIDIL